jgi:deoxyribonuclease V
MTDSQGYAHPRRFGLGCHLGVLLNWPTLGVAKTRFVGQPRGDLGDEKGRRVPLVDGPVQADASGKADAPGEDEETIGVVLRTRTRVKPVYVSLGHRLTLADAVALTLRCCPRYKLPEPTRAAHKLSRAG